MNIQLCLNIIKLNWLSSLVSFVFHQKKSLQKVAFLTHLPKKLSGLYQALNKLWLLVYKCVHIKFILSSYEIEAPPYHLIQTRVPTTPTTTLLKFSSNTWIHSTGLKYIQNPKYYIFLETSDKIKFNEDNPNYHDHLASLRS